MIWSVHSEDLEHQSNAFPDYYLPLGAKGTCLRDHDPELQRELILDLERRQPHRAMESQMSLTTYSLRAAVFHASIAI